MEFWKRPIFWVVVVIVLAVAGWSYYSKQKTASQNAATETQTPVVSNLTNLDPTDFDDSVKSEFALANTKAAEVNTAYKISAIEVNISKDLTVDSINTRYIYSASTDTKNNWMITISATNQSYIRALIPKDDYAGAISPFDVTAWKYNYVTALQLAEKAGGLDWREANTLTAVKITLKNIGAGNQLAWSVEYSANEGTKTINLDATSGKEITQ